MIDKRIFNVAADLLEEKDWFGKDTPCRENHESLCAVLAISRAGRQESNFENLFYSSPYEDYFVDKAKLRQRVVNSVGLSSYSVITYWNDSFASKEEVINTLRSVGNA